MPHGAVGGDPEARPGTIGHVRASGPSPSGSEVFRDPAAEAIQRRAVVSRLGPLTPMALEAIRSARGREFQRLELVGDSVLELVLHAHSAITGPGCPWCAGRADRFTTDTHLTEVARTNGLGAWLDWHPSDRRMADLVEACVGATWASGRWAQAVAFVSRGVHPLPQEEQRRLLHGGAVVHPESAARSREILGAAILEAACATGAYLRHPEGDEGDLSRIRARLLSGEHVMGRARDSAWVHRMLRTRHFDRDDVERLLADDLLSHGLASAVSIAGPLTS